MVSESKGDAVTLAVKCCNSGMSASATSIVLNAVTAILQLQVGKQQRKE